MEEKNITYKTKSEFESSQAQLKKQIETETDIEKRKELSKKIYTKVPDSQALYHNVKIDEKGEPYIDTSFPNEKYVNSQGQEAVFNKGSGAWIDDGINNATYNIGSLGGEDSLIGGYHHLFNDKGDVALWVEYGVSSKDRTTKEQRKKIANLGKIYYLNPGYIFYCEVEKIPISQKTFLNYLSTKHKK